MRSIKLTAAALVLGLTGAFYAVALAQTTTHLHAGANDKPSCCKMHKSEGAQQSASTETCNMKDGGCCGDCCKMHAQQKSAHSHASGDAHSCCAGGGCHMTNKAGAEQSAAMNSDGAAQGDSCAGMDCCKDCACCKAHHAAGATRAAADADGHHDCCAACDMHHAEKTARR